MKKTPLPPFCSRGLSAETFLVLPTKRPGFEAGRKGGGGTSGRTVPGSDGNGGAQSGRYPIRTGTTGCRRTSSSGSERYHTCPKSIARRSMLRIVLSYIVR